MSEIGDKSDPRRRWIRFSRDSIPVARICPSFCSFRPIPSCASEISRSREGEGVSKTMRSSDFSSFPRSGEIKESNFSKVRLHPPCTFSFLSFASVYVAVSFFHSSSYNN